MSLPGTLQVVDHVPQAFAKLVHDRAPSSMALSGGDTARKCYELLATIDVDWSGTSFYFGDERWVPVHDPDSNEGMARTTFLDEVGPYEIHSVYHSGSDTPGGAAAYHDLVRDADPIELIHLGLGPDGHTASIFPGSATVAEQQRLVVAAGDDAHPHQRVTFTLPGIARCQLAVVTVSGTGKADAVARISAGEDLPGSRIAARDVLWLVDRAALGESGIG